MTEIDPGDLNASLTYIRKLEDAVLSLWDEMPVEEVKLLAALTPRLVDFIQHLHHSVTHEEVMVRHNWWAERGEGAPQ